MKIKTSILMTISTDDVVKSASISEVGDYAIQEVFVCESGILMSAGYALWDRNEREYHSDNGKWLFDSKEEAGDYAQDLSKEENNLFSQEELFEK